MPSFRVDVHLQDAEDLTDILDRYGARLAYRVERKGWWSLEAAVTVIGSEPYLSRAKAEVDDLHELLLLRHAW